VASLITLGKGQTQYLRLQMATGVDYKGRPLAGQRLSPVSPDEASATLLGLHAMDAQ